MSGAVRSQGMTKGEREDLLRLVKQRERLAKTAAEQRSAAMLAEFEGQISALHDFNKDEVWRAAVEAVQEETRKANEAIRTRANELGIPEEFHPSISFGWLRRGEHEYRQRRDELRRVAKAEIEAIEKAARVQIETESVRCQTQIIATGLTSDNAVQFLEGLTPVEKLMPALSVEMIQRKLIERARSRSDYRGPYLVPGEE